MSHLISVLFRCKDNTIRVRMNESTNQRREKHLATRTGEGVFFEQASDRSCPEMSSCTWDAACRMPRILHGRI